MASGPKAPMIHITPYGNSIPWPQDDPFTAAIDADIRTLAQQARDTITQVLICENLHGPITYRRYRRGKNRCKHCGAKLS